MPSFSTIGPELLEALHVTEVRDPDAFAELTRQRARATDGGCMIYQLRGAVGAALAGSALTTFGNVPLGNLLFSAISDRLDTEVEMVNEHPLAVCVTVVLRGSFRTSVQGQDKVFGAGEVMLNRIEPGMLAVTEGPCERINIWVSARRLERDLELALGAPLKQPLRFAPEAGWPAGPAASLRRLTTHAAAELADPHSLLAGGVGSAAFEDLLARMLIGGVPHNHSAAIERTDRPVPKAAVHRARDLIFADPTRLPLAAIAARVGCAPRRLAESFRAEYGQSMVAAQRDARLDQAHRMLSRPAAPLPVREVAAQLGFSNVSRFSRQYQDRFGHRPKPS